MQKQQKRRGMYSYRPQAIRGVISVNSRVVGFVAVSRTVRLGQTGTRADEKKGDDIMIETENLATALNKDEVEIEVLPARVRGRRTGRVMRIVKRAKTRFVGTIVEKGTRLVLIPDDFRMYAPLIIPRPPRDAQKGLKALAKITEWKPNQEPTGEIIKIIGKKGEHETEMQSIVLERGFESEFPAEVLREAEHSEKEISPAEIAHRRDFRAATLFTIDPPDAKDFDDALSIQTLRNGRFEIGIHIADVSHYVREGSALDREARERGTSVYLVDRTIPMLPHALSNELCSLNPNVDRLAFSAVFEMDADGKVYARWFGKTVIHSKKRFTYEEAQQLIHNSLTVVIDDSQTVVQALCTLNTIAKNLHAEKMKKGAIDFEHDEVGFELDKKGHPIRVFKKARLDTHKLVEEFMLLANREVAEFFFRNAARAGGRIPFIYRIHDAPDALKLEHLRVFVRALGHELPRGKGGRAHGKDLQALFQKIEGKAEESLIKTAAIRSMAKAAYSTANIGHFGLAFEYYTHFTSPIRRYPDLLVHRLLEAALKRHRVSPHIMEKLERMAEESTQKEIAASDAERESIKLKQVEFMQGFIGREFHGTISGVTEWGIYVEEKETKSEGMVKLRDLGDDYYRVDERNYCIVGERTKKKYALGDAVRFRVVGADLERKTLDYKLIP